MSKKEKNYDELYQTRKEKITQFIHTPQYQPLKIKEFAMFFHVSTEDRHIL